MASLLILIVVGLVGLCLVGGLVAVLVRLTQSPKPQQTYVPHAWQPSSVPGWYPDQSDPNVLRYFDGQAWTSSTTPRAC